MNFYDGAHYVEEVAAARISNLLSHDGIKLNEQQREECARTIMGAMIGYLVGSIYFKPFIDCRKERWGLEYLPEILAMGKITEPE